jgi:hypothetical protein
METSQPMGKIPEREQKPIAMAAGGSAIESFVGLGVAALAILALLGVLPLLLLKIATIALGVALIIESSAIFGRVSFVLREMGETQREKGIFMGGMTIESAGGIGGVALGVLALVGLRDALLPIALIAMGGATVFAAGTISMINSIVAQLRGKSQSVQNIAHVLAVASADIRIVAGLGAVALGILALCHIDPLALTLIGGLSLGTALFFETLSYSAGFANLMGRR